MKTVLGVVFAVAAIGVAYLAGTGRALPFGVPARAALWVVVGLGMTACALGGVGDVLARVGGNWGSPWVLAGIVGGLIALTATWAAASGATLGVVTDARQWLLVLAVVIGAKMVVAMTQAVVTAGAATGRV